MSTRATALRLAPVTPENLAAVCALSVRPDQEHLVSPVVKSLAEAYVHGETAWPRAIVDGDEVVGFVMAFLGIAWNPAEDPGDIRSGLWRLNISAAHQFQGLRPLRGRGGRRRTPPPGRLPGVRHLAPGPRHPRTLLPLPRVPPDGRTERRRNSGRPGPRDPLPLTLTLTLPRCWRRAP